MTTAILIPARLASARLERKLLLKETGYSVLRHTYEACMASQATLIGVATSDQEIADEVQSWAGNVIWTSDKHQNGTSRIAEAAATLPRCIDVVVNVQGDEPAIQASAIDALADALRHTEGPWDAGTLVAPLKAELANSLSTVKAAVSGHRALYFSRAPLAGALHHVGVYAYRRDIVHSLRSLPATELMAAERLEQLGFLELGWNVLAHRISAPFISVDTHADYEQFVRWHRQRTDGNRIGTH